MLSWRQLLLSCHFLCCFFSRSWTPPSHNHYSQDPAFTFPVCNYEVHQSISLPGSCIILSDTSWENADWDFQDKLKEFCTEILQKYFFHLCKYSLFKLNKFSHITSWYTPAFARTVIFYVIGLIISGKSSERSCRSSLAFSVPLALIISYFLPPLKSPNYRTQILLFVPVRLFLWVDFSNRLTWCKGKEENIVWNVTFTGFARTHLLLANFGKLNVTVCWEMIFPQILLWWTLLSMS